MNHLDGYFKSVRDSEIYYQAWLPEKDTKAVILIVHGLGEHSGRYENVVNHFVPLGYAVYGFDLIGHGKSDGEREYIERFEDYTKILNEYIGMVKSWQEDKQLFLLGHSIGGTIVIYYLLDHPQDFPGVVISAPTILIPKGTTQMTIATAKVLSKITPKLGMMQLDPIGVSSDPKVVSDYISDPLVFHGKSPVRFMAETLRAILRINDEFEKLTQPLMVVSGSEDALADPEGSELLFEKVSSQEKEIKIYEGFHHEVLNEPDHIRVLSDIEAWLEDRLS